MPSIFNAVITVSVISVANSATYASTRTLQALASKGMAPKLFAYIDKKGRPIASIILQLIFGLLAFANEATAGDEVFTWLLSLSGLMDFFVWGSICGAHIRFRQGWKARGNSMDEIPYLAPFGIIGSWIGMSLNFLCLVAQFYVALFVSGPFPSLLQSLVRTNELSTLAPWWPLLGSRKLLRGIPRWLPHSGALYRLEDL